MFKDIELENILFLLEFNLIGNNDLFNENGATENINTFKNLRTRENEETILSIVIELKRRSLKRQSYSAAAMYRDYQKLLMEEISYPLR